ncbi:hypothetical protein [Paenibacillus xylanexedens]|uniref:hypothetical protein n=1 Tax=Paenibacillus xylanexedens TaxID=528191 RepID=UPI00119D03F6|nr:hypothetical protein [Paenibacillus xylanexedens]
MSNATQTFREVKRKANAGERIKIVNAGYAGYPPVYSNGDELTVIRDNGSIGVRVDRKWRDGSDIDAWVSHEEYVVLESIVPIAPSTAQLPDLFAQFIRDNAPAVRSYLVEISAEPVAEVSEPAPLTRAKVIEMARERVTELGRIGRDDDARLKGSAKFRGSWFEVDFVVNRDKRAVTALVYELSGFSYTRKRRKPDAVGIAKCAPDDVFNADIGKAIAAERALGLALTDAFVNAPKPDSIVAGMIVRYAHGRVAKTVDTPQPLRGRITLLSTARMSGAVIIDDTDAIYTQEEREAA